MVYGVTWFVTYHPVHGCTMQRTQLMLDEWQYQALKSRAQREGRSMSDLLREMLDAYLGRSGRRGSALDRARGVGEDGTATGRTHDAFLYGRNVRR